MWSQLHHRISLEQGPCRNYWSQTDIKLCASKTNVQRRTAASLLHLIAAKQIPHEQNGPFSDGDPLNLFEFISIWGRELQCWPRFWTPYDPRVSLKTLCFFRTKAITEWLWTMGWTISDFYKIPQTFQSLGLILIFNLNFRGQRIGQSQAQIH